MKNNSKSNILRGINLIGLISLSSAGLSSGAVIITVEESAGNTTFTFNGSINTAGLTPSGVLPANQTLGAGLVLGTQFFLNRRGGASDIYAGVITTGDVWDSFRSSSTQGATSGDVLGFNDGDGRLNVTAGYVSGTNLSGQWFIPGTLADFGATPGDVTTYSWGAGATADSATLTVIPEPSSTALLGLGGLILLRRRRK